MRRSVALVGAVALAALSACDLVEESKAAAIREKAELPVVIAAEAGDLAGLKALLDKDPTLANSYRWTSTGSGKGGPRGRMTWRQRSDSALTASLRKRRIPVVELLLSTGADPNLPIDTGDVPLDILSRTDERDETAETLARLLLSHGASLGPRSRTDHNGGTTTPLLVLLNGTATQPGKEGLLRLYASDASALGVPDIRGLTAIHHAASSVERAAEVLLEAGADPNARSVAGKESRADQRPGDTPLHAAARFQNPEGAFVLCAGGADPRLRNSAGETPQEALRRMAREEPSQFLTSRPSRRIESMAAALAPEGPCGTWHAKFQREGRPTSWGPVHLARLEHGCTLDDGIDCGDLGWAYYKGEDAPVDPAKAMSAFRKACGLGRPWGCGMVGALHDAGDGVPEDPAEAAKWFARGCDGNDAQSCTRLARLASSGRGVPQDRALALALFDKACARKYAAGCEGALALR